MKKLLVLDMGTYCDNAMMDLITNRLQYKYEIEYITTTGRETPSYVKQNYYFDMPSFITNSEIDFDIMGNVVLWGIKHPLKAYELYDWISTMKNLILKAILGNNGNVNGIILHYSVTMLLWRIDPDLIKHIPIYILYYAPGLINRTTPWIFDSVLKSPNFELYNNKHKKSIEDSWESYYRKMSDISMYEKPIEILDTLKKATHIFCWDPAVTAPYSPVFHELKVKHVGFVHAPALPASKDIMDFILSVQQTKQTIAFLAFGSYASSKELQSILPIIFDSLKKAKYSIIFHIGKETPAPEHDWIKYITNVYIYQGYLPYNWIVPKCDLVMFTGSVCMQTVCLYNKVRMIFVPLLAEQFFWARNYQAFTGVPFCNYLKKNIAFRRDLTIALKMDRNKEMRYLNRVAKSMREKDHDGIEGISRAIIS